MENHFLLFKPANDSLRDSCPSRKPLASTVMAMELQSGSTASATEHKSKPNLIRLQSFCVRRQQPGATCWATAQCLQGNKCCQQWPATAFWHLCTPVRTAVKDTWRWLEGHLNTFDRSDCIFCFFIQESLLSTVLWWNGLLTKMWPLMHYNRKWEGKKAPVSVRLDLVAEWIINEEWP